jgi:hypothetical protein
MQRLDCHAPIQPLTSCARIGLIVGVRVRVRMKIVNIRAR